MTAEPYQRNTGGNRLERYVTVPSSTGHTLKLRGPEEIVKQLCWVNPTYQRVGGDAPEWTHVLRTSGTQPNADLLDLLGDVITLPQTGELDVALALDWYKTPVEGRDPYSWPNTAAGQLVADGKYRFKTQPARQRDVGLVLVGGLSSVIQRHPLFLQTDVVVSVPGHDAARASFGERVAATVADVFGWRTVRAVASQEFRPEAKAMQPHERAAALRSQFSVREDLSDKVVLIVDDVYSSGATASETARAARAVGARRVLAICGARTLRR